MSPFTCSVLRVFPSYMDCVDEKKQYNHVLARKTSSLLQKHCRRDPVAHANFGQETWYGGTGKAPLLYKKAVFAFVCVHIV